MPSFGRIVCELDSGEKKFLMKLVPKEKSDTNHLIRKENIEINVEWLISMIIEDIIRKADQHFLKQFFDLR